MDNMANGNMANNSDDGNSQNLSNNDGNANNNNLGNANSNNGAPSKSCYAGLVMPVIALAFIGFVWKRYGHSEFLGSTLGQIVLLAAAVLVGLSLISQVLLCATGHNTAAWVVGAGSLTAAGVPFLPIILLGLLVLGVIQIFKMGPK